MICVALEDGIILLDLHARRSDVLLSCDQAYKLADTIDDAAKQLVASVRPARGEQWSAQIESYDGLVAIRFAVIGGLQHGSPTRVPLPVSAATKFTDALRWKASQAEHKFRIVLQRR